MEKFYLTWSKEAPKNPKEVHKDSWDSGVHFHVQINPSNKSLDEWKKEQVDKFDSLSKEYQENGKIKKLNKIYHPTPSQIESIEKEVDFIEWCSK